MTQSVGDPEKVSRLVAGRRHHLVWYFFGKSIFWYFRKRNLLHSRFYNCVGSPIMINLGLHVLYCEVFDLYWPEANWCVQRLYAWIGKKLYRILLSILLRYQIFLSYIRTQVFCKWLVRQYRKLPTFLRQMVCSFYSRFFIPHDACRFGLVSSLVDIILWSAM
jgi:hypothetical protein